MIEALGANFATFSCVDVRLLLELKECWLCLGKSCSSQNTGVLIGEDVLNWKKDER